jgi:hypothetical protein
VFMVLCLVTYFWGLSSLFVPFFNFFVEHRLTDVNIFSFFLSFFVSNCNQEILGCQDEWTFWGKSKG